MNRKANREYLKNKVYSTFLDLAAVYYIDLRKDVHFQAEYAGTAIIREVFREWNIHVSPPCQSTGKYEEKRRIQTAEA